MNYASVVRVMSMLMLVTAASTIPPILVAVAGREDPQIFAFLVTAIVTTVLAASTLLLTPKPRLKARPSDGLGVVILWWFFTPIVGALPFVLGVANSSVFAAIHESTASLTTTGQSVIGGPGYEWPISLIVWRGVLHLLGCTATIVTAASVLAAINLGGPGIHRTVLFTLPETSFFDAVPRVCRAVVTMMAATLLVVVAALILSGVPVPRALSDGVSAVTTGLVNPDGPAEVTISRLHSVILGIGLAFGALGLAVWLPLREGKVLRTLYDPETLVFLLLLLVLTVLTLPLGLDLTEGIAWATSALSTSGIPLTDAPLDELVPLPLLVIPALIGGSALSAAGGVKIARFIVLARRAGQEFKQLGFRRSVLDFRFRDRVLDERSVLGVWVYLIAYILAVFITMLGFSALHHEFEQATRMSIGCLTNSGSLLFNHMNQIDSGTHALMIFSMILGRLEILALLPAISISFWRG